MTQKSGRIKLPWSSITLEFHYSCIYKLLPKGEKDETKSILKDVPLISCCFFLLLIISHRFPLHDLPFLAGTPAFTRYFTELISTYLNGSKLSFCITTTSVKLIQRGLDDQELHNKVVQVPSTEVRNLNGVLENALEGTLKDHSAQPPCCGQGHLWQDEVGKPHPT